MTNVNDFFNCLQKIYHLVFMKIIKLTTVKTFKVKNNF